MAKSQKTFKVHPADQLYKELISVALNSLRGKGMSAKEIRTIMSIASGTSEVTPEIAQLLEKAGIKTADFWLELQQNYSGK